MQSRSPFSSPSALTDFVRQIIREMLPTSLNDGLRFFVADKNTNNQYDPLTAGAWEAGSPAASGTLNWNSVFAVPKRATAVLLFVTGTITWKANSGATNAYSTTGEQRIVPIYTDGTSAWSAAAGTVTVRVLGWWA